MRHHVDPAGARVPQRIGAGHASFDRGHELVVPDEPALQTALRTKTPRGRRTCSNRLRRGRRDSSTAPSQPLSQRCTKRPVKERRRRVRRVAPRPTRVSQRERGADDFLAAYRRTSAPRGRSPPRFPGVPRAPPSSPRTTGLVACPPIGRPRLIAPTMSSARAASSAAPPRVAVPPPRRRGRLQLPPRPESHQALAGLRAAGAHCSPRRARPLPGFPRPDRTPARVPSAVRAALTANRFAKRASRASRPEVSARESQLAADFDGGSAPAPPHRGSYSRAGPAAVRSSTGEGGDEPASFAPAAARRAMGERDATRRLSANARPTLRKGNPREIPARCHQP